MTSSYASGRTLYLAKKLDPSGTVTLTSDPGPTNGRIYLSDGSQVEWIAFESVSVVSGNYVLGGTTRDIDPVAVPMASLSTGKTWLATQKCVLVAMHDQLWDRTQGGPFASYTSAQLAARTTKQVGETFYDTTLGSLVYWNGSSYQSFGTGTFVNASQTSSGWVELATDAETLSGASSGSAGPLVATPAQIAKNSQSGVFTYAPSTDGTDTYTVTLVPALAAYSAGMSLRVKFTTANTGACTINANGLGAKAVKLRDGTDPLDGDIIAGSILDLVYDGTNFVIDASSRASNSEWLAGTNATKFVTPYNTAVTVVASDVLLAASNGTSTTTSGTYVKAKEIVANVAGTYRVTFGLLSQLGGDYGFGRIYKNGVAFGTERTTISTSEQTYSEDLAFAAGDLVQLYQKSAGGVATSVLNFHVNGSAFPKNFVPTVNL